MVKLFYVATNAKKVNNLFLPDHCLISYKNYLSKPSYIDTVIHTLKDSGKELIGGYGSYGYKTKTPITIDNYEPALDGYLEWLSRYNFDFVQNFDAHQELGNLVYDLNNYFKDFNTMYILKGSTYDVGAKMALMEYMKPEYRNIGVTSKLGKSIFKYCKALTVSNKSLFGIGLFDVDLMIKNPFYGVITSSWVLTRYTILKYGLKRKFYDSRYLMLRTGLKPQCDKYGVDFKQFCKGNNYESVKYNIEMYRELIEDINKYDG